MAARDQKRAQEFADKHAIRHAHGSYQELADNKEVDVAYVGVICPMHFDVVKMMLNAGW